jgi:hypothetical protein
MKLDSTTRALGLPIEELCTAYSVLLLLSVLLLSVCFVSVVLTALKRENVAKERVVSSRCIAGRSSWMGSLARMGTVVGVCCQANNYPQKEKQMVVTSNQAIMEMGDAFSYFSSI